LIDRFVGLEEVRGEIWRSTAAFVAVHKLTRFVVYLFFNRTTRRGGNIMGLVSQWPAKAQRAELQLTDCMKTVTCKTELSTKRAVDGKPDLAAESIARKRHRMPDVRVSRAKNTYLNHEVKP
jgi:hypothetical protein